MVTNLHPAVRTNDLPGHRDRDVALDQWAERYGQRISPAYLAKLIVDRLDLPLMDELAASRLAAVLAQGLDDSTNRLDHYETAALLAVLEPDEVPPFGEYYGK